MDNKSIKMLADLEFATLLTEAVQTAQTSAGHALLAQYQQYLMTNEANYQLVNSFLRESKNCLFDNAVSTLANKVASYISGCKYSWQLASACESILNTTTSVNYLGRNACKQVNELLEGKTEEDVVKYIKAGALRNVMFVEQFRNIAKAIYKDQPVVECTAEYKAVTPVSMTESNNGATYFEIAGRIYKINEGVISRADSKEVSNEFMTISKLIESNAVSFDNDKFSMQIGNFLLETCKEGECTKKKCKDGKCEKCGKDAKDCTCEGEVLNVGQLREFNEMYLNATGRFNDRSGQNAFLLEAFAKLVENYDKMSHIDIARVITTNNDQFVVIENNGNVFAEPLKSNHNTARWECNTDVVEAIKYIKSQTNVDLNEHFKTQVEKVIESKTAEEKQKVLESIHADEMNARRERIEKLTEQYKNDPIKLAMLSKIAEDLSKLA